MLTIVTGNVTARYRDFVVTAQKGQVDYKTNLAVFEGNVVLPDRHSGGARRSDRDQHQDLRVVFQPAKTTITPEFTRATCERPCSRRQRRSGASGTGSSRRSALTSPPATCRTSTTTSRPRASSSIPNDKIVFRNAELHRARQEALHAAAGSRFRSGRSRRTRTFCRRVGNTAEEGFFMKYAYP